ncbi:unnamed protein product [Tetraodon nigroviridis]|uniref:(spotted green pufferfish) hypothetical protein n=1 Tax=Tetraodon nigroviridis TaxID=99883 RepID=Q4T1L1_TETNG|nr:unnamed protein product [Tetraodon nigroviridis]
MFNLMKKDKEREATRKEKKDKKERMSAAELRTLEEMSMRRGFFNLKREAKRESKTKLEISNPIPIKVASGGELTLTDLESDGLSNRSSVVLDEQLSAASSTDDLKGEGGGGGGPEGQPGSVRDPERARCSACSAGTARGSRRRCPPAGSARAPELVEKIFPAALQLPLVVPPSAPETRQLEVQRRNTGDFGFSLRRTTMLDRSPDGGVYRRVVHFAEPGAGTKDLALGLVPGDRLVEINGRNVESKTRDEIVEMIRQSGDSVRLKVQPILELSELSRCWLRNADGPRWDSRHLLFASSAPTPPPMTADAGRGLFRAKSPLPAAARVRSPSPPKIRSPVKVPERFKSPEPPPTRAGLVQNPQPTPAPRSEEEQSAAADTSAADGDLPGTDARRKKVKVVRRVVRKVLPLEKSEAGAAVAMPMQASAPSPGSRPAPGAASFSFKHESIRTEDEVLPGLTSLMARGRTREPEATPPPRPAPRQAGTGEDEGEASRSGRGEGGASRLATIRPSHSGSPAPRCNPDQVAPLSPTEEAQTRLMKIFNAPTNQGQVDVDPAALLQAAHHSAQPPQVKTEEQMAAEQAWYESEKVWLVHKDGFSLATVTQTEAGSLPEGKLRIRLEQDGTVLDVDEDDVEKANPPSYDRCQDLASLLYLNESSVMHSLRQRYGGNLIYTHAGPNMVVVNPVSTPSMYSEKVMHMFKGCRREDSAPHIYAVAQAAYRSLLTTRQDQSVVLLGKSGSGKTTNCQHLLQYLVSVAGSSGRIFSGECGGGRRRGNLTLTAPVPAAEKWQAVYTILEAFGNSSTAMNSNASRFAHVVSLDFDQAGQVASASVQVRWPPGVSGGQRSPAGLNPVPVPDHAAGEAEGEQTPRSRVHLQRLLLPAGRRRQQPQVSGGAGPPRRTLQALTPRLSVFPRTELHFNHLAERSAFGILPPSKGESVPDGPAPEEKQRAAQQFTKLQAAMKVLGVSGEEQKALWLVLGAIYHLGAAGATKAGRRQFAHHEWAQKAAYLLGCTLEELSSSIFKQQARGLQHSASFRGGADESGQGDGSGAKVAALECLEAMASGLYSELFTLVVSLINRALKSSQHSLCSLLIVDTPGFQNPRLAQQQRGATFEELCHNYTQERLQTLFHERTFVREMERYKEENIELALDDVESSTSLSVAAVDQASTQALVRTLARTDEARGLLWLMEEEAVQPGGSEETMLDRLFSYYGSVQGGSKGGELLLRGDKPHLFLLGHSHGTDWVQYNTHGWLGHARHNPAAQNAATLLQDSQKKNISGLFMGRAGGATVLSGSIAGLEGSSQLALRRATSMRKTFTTGVAAVKKKSLCIQVKLQVDALIDMVRRSKVHFVHCLLPRAEVAGGGEPRPSHGEGLDPGLMTLDVGLLRAQLRGSRLLDALRIYRQGEGHSLDRAAVLLPPPSSPPFPCPPGYPDHMVFSEFRRRFDVLAPHLTKKHGRHYIVTDERRAVEELLESLELEKSSYHMGLSKVFFRAGTLSRLEEQRDLQTRRNITLFQAACRGYLARHAFKKRKIQDLAIRCIQKNIKKNGGVKDWPWWRLFTTVRPLIQVQLTEEQIRGKDEEIQQLRQKLEKVEKERNELRLNSDRLESRITELSSELADERNTGESASQLLETETSERLRLEKDLKELQAQSDSVKKQMESMEMEVMEARLIRASELNGEMEDDGSGGEWRLKYERAIREIEFTKKRLQQELDDKLEVEQQSKRQLERRVSHRHRQQRQVARSTPCAARVCVCVCAQISDLQADNEESQRNVQQLKKKTQRLTAELQDTKLHLEGQQSRNHDAGEEAEEDKDLEVCSLNLKLERLEAELQDLNSQESKDEASLARLKKQTRELEARVKDQEEELDEQAGTIQMLEQAKLRLEMEMERQRQSHSKEVESKDEEVEEIRQSCSKKLKQMEVQLEEEYDEKQKVMKEKRELESKLLSAEDKVGPASGTAPVPASRTAWSPERRPAPQVRGGDVETEKRLRKDLKRTKALLVDAQIMLDHIKNNAPSKREIAQLKNQLEESEFTCAAAVKARKSMEVELEDLHVQMEDISRAKQALEEQLSRLQREKNDLQSRMEEDQEDLNDLMKKHKAAVAQSAQNLAQISDLQAQLEEALKEKQEVQEKLQALQSQLEFQEQSMVEKSLVSRQEAKTRELESRLEFERTQVKRLESLVARLKENMEKLTEDRDQRSGGENREKEQNKRLQRQIRDLKEEMGELAKKEAEASRKKHEPGNGHRESGSGQPEPAGRPQAGLQKDRRPAGSHRGRDGERGQRGAHQQFAGHGDKISEKAEPNRKENGRNLFKETLMARLGGHMIFGEGDSDSEVEDRVDGVKSWLSKSKGSSRNLSDDGSLKSSRRTAQVGGAAAWAASQAAGRRWSDYEAAPSRSSARLSPEDDGRSSVSAFSRRGAGRYASSPASPCASRAGSRFSLARSCNLSELDLDDSRSVVSHSSAHSHAPTRQEPLCAAAAAGRVRPGPGSRPGPQTRQPPQLPGPGAGEGHQRGSELPAGPLPAPQPGGGGAGGGAGAGEPPSARQQPEEVGVCPGLQEEQQQEQEEEEEEQLQEEVQEEPEEEGAVLLLFLLLLFLLGLRVQLGRLHRLLPQRRQRETSAGPRGGGPESPAQQEGGEAEEEEGGQPDDEVPVQARQRLTPGAGLSATHAPRASGATAPSPLMRRKRRKWAEPAPTVTARTRPSPSPTQHRPPPAEPKNSGLPQRQTPPSSASGCRRPGRRPLLLLWAFSLQILSSPPSRNEG